MDCVPTLGANKLMLAVLLFFFKILDVLNEMEENGKKKPPTNIWALQNLTYHSNNWCLALWQLIMFLIQFSSKHI